jgi:hypothetical protein
MMINLLCNSILLHLTFIINKLKFFLFIPDSVRYHAAIKLVNISAILNENINEHLQLKILKYVSTYFITYIVILLNY